MNELTADQALFLLQSVYLGSLKNESRITKKVLEAVPPGKCEHRPDPVSKSAIELWSATSPLRRTAFSKR